MGLIRLEVYLTVLLDLRSLVGVHRKFVVRGLVGHSFVNSDAGCRVLTVFVRGPTLNRLSGPPCEVVH